MDITITLNVDDINLIIAQLAKLKYEKVYTLIPKIKNQAEAAIAAKASLDMAKEKK